MADGKDDPSLPPHSPATYPQGEDAAIIEVEPEIENQSSGGRYFPHNSPAGGDSSEMDWSDSSLSGEDEEQEISTRLKKTKKEQEIDDCVKFITGRLPKQTSSSGELEFLIPKVPDRLRQAENYAYEPDIISIGPYHHGIPRLQAMENKKLEHLSHILSQKSAFSLQELVRKLKPLEARVRRCYSADIKLDSNEFVEMMLIDSCFIIHLLLQAVHGAKKTDGMIWIGPLMLYDLLLLENQLPFFLVQFVFEITNNGKCPSSLVQLVYKSYCLVTRKKIFKDENLWFLRTEPVFHPVFHLLHLYHWFNIYPLILPPPSKKPESKWMNLTHAFHVLNMLKKGLSSLPCGNILSKTAEAEEEESGIMIPNATVLHEVGIKFRRKKTGSILDVKFTDGVIEIPPVCVYDGAVSLFRNLIAFEQCYEYYFSDLPQFAAYFKFLDHMINTVSDVTLLQKNGIIEHSYGSEKEIAHLFNQLTRGATINTNNYLSDLYKKVNRYCKKKRKKRHVWSAILHRRHCSNPWTILSLIGALILLALTFVQTYFSVYSYFQPSSKSSP